MINKFLQKRIEITAEVVSTETERQMELEYYLIESVSDDLYELADKKVYGIEIVKKEIGKSSECVIESEIVKNFTCCRESAENLVDKLADNSVTPVTLPYILEDLVVV